jgi:serine/threonine-protein kinase ATR
VDAFHASNSLSSSTLPFAAEAAWSAGKWEQLERVLKSSPSRDANTFLDFNVGVGRALLALRRKDNAEFKAIIAALRGSLAAGLSPSSTASIQACHDQLVKLHALYELEAISGATTTEIPDRAVILENLDRRLDIIGAYTSDKQYLLGVRRATMLLSRYFKSHWNVILSKWLIVTASTSPTLTLLPHG